MRHNLFKTEVIMDTILSVCPRVQRKKNCFWGQTGQDTPSHVHLSVSSVYPPAGIRFGHLDTPRDVRLSIGSRMLRGVSGCWYTRQTDTLIIPIGVCPDVQMSR